VRWVPASLNQQSERNYLARSPAKWRGPFSFTPEKR